MSGKRLSLFSRDKEGLLIYGNVLRNCDDICPHLESDVSIEAAAKRVFVVGGKYILSDLKELTRNFGLNWNFITYRTRGVYRCNSTYRKDREKFGLR